MTQITDQHRAASAQITVTPRRRILALLLRMGFALAIGWAMWWLVWSTVGSRNHWFHSLFVPVSVVLAAGLFIFRNERHWARPAREFKALLSEVRDGRAPIEELTRVQGGLASLVPVVQDILRDLKQQKGEITKLSEEIRQRIAGRTEALERQLGSMRAQATRDSLTGLFNRRMFDIFLPKMIERCIADKVDLSVLMIDVDSFKLLNDSLGHVAGDELLRDIAQLIRSGIREQDSPFRLGGDEFVVILPMLDPAAATEVARRLIEVVDALAKSIDTTCPPRLSVGAASISQLVNKNATELVHLADKRLYEMKAIRQRGNGKRLRASA